MENFFISDGKKICTGKKQGVSIPRLYGKFMRESARPMEWLQCLQILGHDRRRELYSLLHKLLINFQ
jgi:hypothetical protein